MARELARALSDAPRAPRQPGPQQAAPGQRIRGASGRIYTVIGANAMIAQLGG